MVLLLLLRKFAVFLLYMDRNCIAPCQQFVSDYCKICHELCGAKFESNILCMFFILVVLVV